MKEIDPNKMEYFIRQARIEPEFRHSGRSAFWIALLIASVLLLAGLVSAIKAAPAPENVSESQQTACPGYYTVHGRVAQTLPNNSIRGVFRATVVIWQYGEPIGLRITNPFGYYRFDHVPACGQPYVMEVTHKWFEFEPEMFTIPIADDKTNQLQIDFIVPLE